MWREIRRDVRRRLVRALVVIGVAHVVDAVLVVWLWRHRHAVVRQLADAAAELGRRGPGAGEGAPGPRATPPPSAFPDRGPRRA